MDSFGIGDREIVADELNVRLTHELGPSRPVVLVESVLDGNDRVIRDEVLSCRDSDVITTFTYSIIYTTNTLWKEKDSDVVKTFTYSKVRLKLPKQGKL